MGKTGSCPDEQGLIRATLIQLFADECGIAFPSW